MIPPRPWRVEIVDGVPRIGWDASAGISNLAVIDHVIRLVNAEPEIVAALEAADRMLLACAGLAGHYGAATEGKAAADAVRAALAKVRP